MSTDFTNVCKKGRPRFIDPEWEATAWAKIYPTASYRTRCSRLKVTRVRSDLAEAVGEDPFQSAGAGAECRPLQAKRWPWLLGNRVQYTVLAQLYGLPPEGVVEVADQIERLHEERGCNAKRAIKAARSYADSWWMRFALQTHEDGVTG